MALQGILRFAPETQCAESAQIPQLLQESGKEGDQNHGQTPDNSPPPPGTLLNPFITEKESLMDQLQTFSDQVAQVKRKCKELEPKTEEFQGQKHLDSMIRELKYLKNSLSGKDQLVSSKKYLDEELTTLEGEAQFMKNLVEKVYNTNISTIARLHRNLLQAQKQVIILGYKLCEVEDSNKLSKCDIQQLQTTRSFFSQDDRTSEQTLLDSIKENNDQVCKNMSAIAESCKILCNI
ncbi:hypothetical protein Pmani_021368 [Petrolisthes manimaculis]|uniref:Uncharacterized protein n=1 Tax=Petrolisthes manimaculis TaxID=1843537 RepID=A0AAE1U5J5_9EUCA|nr:hypothetical protein Pmani_021368 [Petrolisthes manimaculis]